MPQMHLYLPDKLASKVKKRAASLGISSSKYMANIVKEKLSTDWPDGYFDSFKINDPSFFIDNYELPALKDIDL